MGYITVERITDLVNNKIAGTDLFIGDIKVKSGNSIYVFLDGDQGITIEQCVDISRHIENSLDRTREDFELHVSSYGIGQPLKFFRQYKNAIGKMLSVITEEGTKYVGKLLHVEEGKIVLETEETKKKQSDIQIEIPFQTIKTAKIEVVFNHE